MIFVHLDEESAKASVQAAEIYESLEKGYAAAAQYSKAAREYKLNDNSKLSEHYLKMAIDLWSTDGKFSMAAKAMKDLAEDAEKEGDNDGAARLFSQAAEFYETADQTRSLPPSLIIRNPIPNLIYIYELVLLLDAMSRQRIVSRSARSTRRPRRSSRSSPQTALSATLVPLHEPLLISYV